MNSEEAKLIVERYNTVSEYWGKDFADSNYLFDDREKAKLIEAKKVLNIGNDKVQGTT